MEFTDEEGTGLGPSLEFYALVAAELQRRTLGVWLCDDDVTYSEAREVRHCTRLKGKIVRLVLPLQVDLGHGVKPLGYYIQQSHGLFPAPWPQDSPELPHVTKLMELLGMFLAKCIQDGRRVDLPLSRSFFKLMCTSVRRDRAEEGREGGSEENSGEYSQDSSRELSPSLPNWSSVSQAQDLGQNDNTIQQSNRNSQLLDNQSLSSTGSGGGGGETTNLGEASRPRAQHGEAGLKEAELVLVTHTDEISKDGSSKEDTNLEQLSSGAEGAWFDGILDMDDLRDVNPYRSRFLEQLKVLIQHRDTIMKNSERSSLEKEEELAALTLPGTEENLPGAKLEDLW